MQREILDVKRCTICGTVVQAWVQDDMLDEQGEAMRAVYWLPRRVHTRDDCRTMLGLAGEEWPVLFELESK